MVILASPKCMNPLPRRHKFLNFGGKFHDCQIRAFSLSPIALEMEVTRFNTYLLYAIVNIIFWFFLTKHLTMPLYVTKWFRKNNHEWTFSSCIFFFIQYNVFDEIISKRYKTNLLLVSLQKYQRMIWKIKLWFTICL